MTNEQISTKIEQYIRPLTFPVGVKISGEKKIPLRARLFAMTADDEMVFSIPRTKIDGVLEGIETTHKRGVSRVPPLFFGMRQKPEFPKRYEALAQICGMSD